MVNQINYDQAESGYIVTNEADERFKLYLECGLCRHVADELLACSIYQKNYCRSCIRILIDAKKLVKKRSNIKNEEIIEQNMVCFNRCIIGKTILYMNTEVKKLEKRVFNCSNDGCKFKNKWEPMPGHWRMCLKKNKKYRINGSYLPYVYTQKEEIEYHIQKESYMFLEKRMIEAYKVQRCPELSIESWETPNPKQSTSVTELTKKKKY